MKTWPMLVLATSMLCGCSAGSRPVVEASAASELSGHVRKHLTCRVVEVFGPGFFDDELRKDPPGDQGGAELVVESPDSIRGLKIALHFGLSAPRSLIQQIERGTILSFRADVPPGTDGAAWIMYVGSDGLDDVSFAVPKKPDQAPEPMPPPKRQGSS